MSASEDDQPGVLDAIRWHRDDEEGAELEVVHDPQNGTTVFFDAEECADRWIEADDDWVLEVRQ
jgi:hypothetical protein